MSNATHYSESESFLTEQSEIPGATLIENLKNEKFLQTKISDAEMKIAEYKELEDKVGELENKVGELQNKVETQELKIDHLEKMLDEKILESEMQKVQIDGKKTPAPILKASPKTVIPKENFGLSKKQLEEVSKYGCIGHYLDDDEGGDEYGGLKWTDKICFALLVKAIKNGLSQFTLKFGGTSHEWTAGNAKLTYSTEKIKLESGYCKWIKQLSITLYGRPVRFKARCQIMVALAGFEIKKYEFKEANSDGLYEQILLNSDWEERSSFFTRLHVTIIN